MKVYPINFTAQTKYKKTNINSKSQHTTPVKNGLSTAAAWFSFGVGLDYISRHFANFTKSPMKNSLLLNGIIGAGAGIFTGTKAVINRKRD